MQTIDEPIHLAEYDSSWPDIASAECKRLGAALDFPLERLEHIGSTAVPDLLAKPVIDIMLGVDSWPPGGGIADTIGRLGYESLGEAGVSERLYFRLRSTTSFNLHVVLIAGSHWRANIALRDYLRGNQDARVRYARIKLAALSAGRTTLLAYSEAKSPAVAELLSAALDHANAGQHARRRAILKKRSWLENRRIQRRASFLRAVTFMGHSSSLDDKETLRRSGLEIHQAG